MAAASKHDAAAADSEPKPKWEKVLWRRQPYPDNYVPPSYLAELDDLREFILGIVDA